MFECAIHACGVCLAHVVHMITRGSCQADILGVFILLDPSCCEKPKTSSVHRICDGVYLHLDQLGFSSLIFCSSSCFGFNVILNYVLLYVYSSVNDVCGATTYW